MMSSLSGVTATPTPNDCIPILKTGFWSLGSIPTNDDPTTIDLSQFNLASFKAINQAKSQDGKYLAFAAYSLIKGQRQSVLAIGDIAQHKAQLLHQYQAVEWGEIEIDWSPDNQWIAFLPSNAAFGDDNGIWIFSSDGKQKYFDNHPQIIDGWSENSHYLYFIYKDAYGFIDTQTWKTTEGERCSQP